MSTIESAATETVGEEAATDAGVHHAAEQQGREASRSGPATPVRPQRRINGVQVLGALLIAGVCLAGAMWYVPRIVAADTTSFTGTVSGNGVTNLNFANPGLVGKVSVHLGQIVSTGQVLATETAPSTTASVSADRAAIAADRASLAELRAAPATAITQASVADAEAQLAKDQALLAVDQIKLSETQIVAPAAGTVIAINGQVGETVTSAGIRSYSPQPQTPTAEQPPFSLLPEGPAATVRTRTSQSALPMIALRTSATWEVTMLVPESAVSSVRIGEKATIAVPAIGLKGVDGYIQQLSPTPVSTLVGTAYEVLVTIRGHQRVTPLGGMTADVQLSS